MSEFLDRQGLKVYDEKVKQYINDKVADMTGITLNGEKGYKLIADGSGNVPKWQQPTGYLVNSDTDAIRSVACENFVLLTGAQATIKFTYAFTSQGSAQLNINNTGAKSLVYNDGTAITSANSWAAGDTLTVFYDGTKYVVLGVAPSKKVLVDLLYPVGTVMTFVNTVNPNTQFGGTWEQIKGQFLFGAEDSGDYTLGANGGSKDAVIVAHNHKSYFTFHYIPNEQGGESVTVLGEYTGASGRTVSVDTTEVGESGTGKNMPPYLCVNIWKRTA